MNADPPARTFEVDLRLYRLVAVQKTVHRYTRWFRGTIERTGDDRVRVGLRPKGDVPLDAVPRLADFENELLDQELREAVAAETLVVRNLILAQAFSGTNLLDPVGESADPDADPLGIARPDKAR